MDDDDISKWAQNLSPEGSPGVMTQKMREYLGDAGYEKAVAQNDAITNLAIQRQGFINDLLSLTVMLIFGFGFVGLVAAIALVVKFIF